MFFSSSYAESLALSIDLQAKLRQFTMLSETNHSVNMNEFLEDQLFCEFLAGNKVFVSRGSKDWIQLEVPEVVENIHLLRENQEAIFVILRLNPKIANWFFCIARDDEHLPPMPSEESALEVFFMLLVEKPLLAEKMWFSNPKLLSWYQQYIKPDTLHEYLELILSYYPVQPIFVKSLLSSTKRIDNFFTLKQALIYLLSKKDLKNALTLYLACQQLQGWFHGQWLDCEGSEPMMIISLKEVEELFQAAYEVSEFNICLDLINNNVNFMEALFGINGFAKKVSEEDLIHHFQLLLKPDLITAAFNMLNANTSLSKLLASQLKAPGNPLVDQIKSLGVDFVNFIMLKIPDAEIGTLLALKLEPCEINKKQMEVELNYVDAFLIMSNSLKQLNNPMSMIFKLEQEDYRSIFLKAGFSLRDVDKFLTYPPEILSSLFQSLSLLLDGYLSTAEFSHHAMTVEGIEFLVRAHSLNEKYGYLFEAFEFSIEKTMHTILNPKASLYTQVLFNAVEVAQQNFPHLPLLVSLIKGGNFDTFRLLLDSISYSIPLEGEAYDSFKLFVTSHFQQTSTPIAMVEPQVTRYATLLPGFFSSTTASSNNEGPTPVNRAGL